MPQYLELAPKVSQSEWESMEKSIIANFADDVSIGKPSNERNKIF